MNQTNKNNFRITITLPIMEKKIMDKLIEKGFFNYYTQIIERSYYKSKQDYEQIINKLLTEEDDE